MTTMCFLQKSKKASRAPNDEATNTEREPTRVGNSYCDSIGNATDAKATNKRRDPSHVNSKYMEGSQNNMWKSFRVQQYLNNYQESYLHTVS